MDSASAAAVGHAATQPLFHSLQVFTEKSAQRRNRIKCAPMLAAHPQTSPLPQRLPVSTLVRNPVAMRPDFRPQGVGPPGRQLRTTSKSSRVPPTAHYERSGHRLQTIVAAQRSASPTQPTRIETHACQEWSMTDLNSSTNQPKSRCILLDSPCWPPIKTHRTNPSAKLDARRMLHRTDWPGPTFGSSPAENPPPGVADRDE